MQRIIERDNLPSTVFNRDNHQGSIRYQQVATIDIIDKLALCGWKPVNVQCTRSRVKEAEQIKHLIKLQHVDTLNQTTGEALQMLLVNSHDCSAAFRFYLGQFRFVCMNGLVIGDTFKRISVRHIGHALDKVEKTVEHVLDIAPTINAEVDGMKQKTLTLNQVSELCNEAYKLKYGDIDSLVNPLQLNRHHRWEDEGMDAWKVFNRVQENIIRGRVRVLVEKQVEGVGGNLYNIKGYKKLRSVTNIEKNIKLNKELWDLFKNAA